MNQLRRREREPGEQNKDAGFAVAAHEVKVLAKQTATATEHISRKIEAIQTDAKGAVRAIASISEVIGVAQAAESTSQGATDSQEAAKILAQMSTQLREWVGRFKIEQRNKRPEYRRTGQTDEPELREREAELVSR